MKTIKSIFFTALGISFLLLTGCTITQELPYDDVYNSGSVPAEQNIQATQYASTPTTQNNTYNKGKVKVVQVEVNKNVTPADTNVVQKEVILIKKDTVTGSEDNSGLGFDDPYFGSGVSAWTMGGYPNWNLSFGYSSYWNYSPFYSPYFWGSPYYGWSNWGWGNPYYGWNYPYYSWNYPYYYWNYPFYMNYYNPYYSIAQYRNARYGHRNGRLNGGNIRMSGINGGMVLHSGINNVRSKRATVNSSSVKNSQKATPARPTNSMRFQKALNEKTAAQNANSTQFRKPSSTFRGTTSTTYKRTQQGTPRIVAKPKYQKPRQYQSLNNRNPRSSKEYYRTQSNNLIQNTQTRNGITNSKRKYNLYRPSVTQTTTRPSNFKNTNTRTIRYRTPTNRPSSNSFKTTRTYKSSGSRNFTPSRSYTPRTTSTSVRTTTGGSRSTGGGGNRR